MLEKIRAMIRENDICVLATASGSIPHCSLMSYMADPECRRMFLVTHRETRKYRNLLENPRVSILIDNRQEGAQGDVARKTALTISGIFESVDPGKKDLVRKDFLKEHPQLKELVDNAGSEIFAVRFQDFQLLEGIQDSYYSTAD